MTEHPMIKAAQHLSEIIEAHVRLRSRAIDHGSHRLMPGGEAMAASGPVANLEAWENMNAAGEVLGRAYTSAVDEDPEDAWSPAQTIEFWAEAWRRERGAEYDDHRRDITTEAKFLKASLEWAWDHEPHFGEFLADMRQARTKLENLLHEGERAERSRVVCNLCDDAPRLILRHGDAPDGSEDHHYCPACRHRFDAPAFRDARAAQLRSTSAARMVSLRDAIGTLKAQGRSERTIRKWLAPNEDDLDGVVEGYCDLVTRRTFIWWPDLWRLHLATRSRQRAQQTTAV